MIPKIIHFCWLSKEEFPEEYKRCMESWKILEDSGYKFIHWDYDRCKDIINYSPFIKKCYEAKAYAFVCDYIRCYVLYHYGGIYLDCDVEVLRSFDDLLHLPYAISIENKRLNHIEFAIMLFSPGNKFLSEMIDFYENYDDLGENYIDIIPIVALTVLENKLREIYYLKLPEDLEKIIDDYKNLYIFPKEYFSPKAWGSNQYTISQNSYTIHHFNGGWVSKGEKNLYKIEPNGIRIDKGESN